MVIRPDTVARAAQNAASQNSKTQPNERSEEHTSELQSPCNLVCRLLLEKNKNVPTFAKPTNPPAGQRNDLPEARSLTNVPSWCRCIAQSSTYLHIDGCEHKCRCCAIYS